jgi:Mg-chelatase subunit ChlD
MMRRTAMAGGLLIGALVWVSVLHFLSSGIGQTESQPAQDGSRALIKFLDKSRFYEDGKGEVSLRMDIVDAAGKPILGLSKESVRVSEESSPADIIAFQGPGTQPINVILVIDISGSMGDENKISGATDAALSALQELKLGRDRLGIIAFDNRFDVVQPLETLNAENKPLCELKIRALRPRGATVIGLPALEALRLFEQQAPDGPKVVMVMTDGQDNSLAGVVETIAAQSDKCGVPVYTIGFGGDAMGAEAVLRDLARKCKAEFYHAPTAQELAKIYRSQVQELTNEFTVTYHSPYATADGLPRRVDVEIDAAAGTLAASTGYQIGSIVDSGGRAVPKAQADPGVLATAVSTVAKLWIFGVLFALLSGALVVPEAPRLRQRLVGLGGPATAVTPASSTTTPTSAPARSLGAPRMPPPPPSPRKPVPAANPPPAPQPAAPSSLAGSGSPTPVKPAPAPRPAPSLSGPPGTKSSIRPIAPPPPPPPGKPG